MKLGGKLDLVHVGEDIQFVERICNRFTSTIARLRCLLGNTRLQDVDIEAVKRGVAIT